MAGLFDRSDPLSNRPSRPRLRRSRHERVLFGVCGGLAEYLGLDPTVVRVVVVLAALFPATTALALLGYVALAVLLPEEGSEHLPARDRMQRNLTGLREDLGGLTDTVRSGLRGSASSRPITADDLPKPVPGDEEIERAANAAGGTSRREM